MKFSLGKRQINSLAKILEYSEDETLVEEKQTPLKKECMDAWEIPIKARREPSRDQPEFICRRLLDNDSGEKFDDWKKKDWFFEDGFLDDFFFVAFLKQNSKNIVNCDMSESLYTIYDWHAVILGTNKEATFYLGKSIYGVAKLCGKSYKVIVFWELATLYEFHFT